MPVWTALLRVVGGKVCGVLETSVGLSALSLGSTGTNHPYVGYTSAIRGILVNFNGM
jgi:hypothetical protein